MEAPLLGKMPETVLTFSSNAVAVVTVVDVVVTVGSVTVVATIVDVVAVVAVVFSSISFRQSLFLQQAKLRPRHYHNSYYS